MDGLLTVSSTRTISQLQEQIAPATQSKAPASSHGVDICSPENALQLLQSKPNLEDLVRCLRWFPKASRLEEGAFNLKVPSPKAAQILNTLVNDIVPHFWPVLKAESEPNHAKERRLLLGCLTSVAGIGALAVRLKNLLAAGKATKKPEQGDSKENTHNGLLRDTLEVLENILRGDKILGQLLRDILQSVEKPLQRTLVWKELVSWLASGRLLSISAEASESLEAENPDGDYGWLASGKDYTKWLGRNIKTLEPHEDQDLQEFLKLRALVLGKSLSLGYRGKAPQDKNCSLLMNFR